jgi:hypothetical protein
MIQSVDCKKERPKYFSQQLQVSLVLTNSLIQVFSPQYLQRFSHKFRTIYTNIHQNFILYIDTILNCCNINPTENLNYILLRKLIVKKLKNKQKSQRLTCFRQNNEVNLLIIKKICRSLVEQTVSDLLDFKDFTDNLLDILRSYEQMSIAEIYESVKKNNKVIKKRGCSPTSSPTKKSRSGSRNNSPKT